MLFLFDLLKPYELPPASQGLVSGQAINPTNYNIYSVLLSSFFREKNYFNKDSI